MVLPGGINDHIFDWYGRMWRTFSGGPPEESLDLNWTSENIRNSSYMDLPEHEHCLGAVSWHKIFIERDEEEIQSYTKRNIALVEDTKPDYNIPWTK